MRSSLQSLVVVSLSAGALLAAGCLSDLTGTKCNPTGLCGEGLVCDRPAGVCDVTCRPGSTPCDDGSWCAVTCPGTDGGAGGGAGGGTAGGAGGGTAGGAGGGTGGGTAGGTGGGGTVMQPDAGPCTGSGAFNTGLRRPTASSTVSSTAQWKNPGATALTDGQYALTDELQYQQVSDALVVKGLGLSVPATAQVLGITVTVVRGASVAGPADYAVRLLKPGTAGVPRTAPGTQWPTALTPATYGGSADLWGTTWTPADVVHPDFGFSLVVRNLSGAAASAQVDSVTVSVAYAVAGVVVGPLMAKSIVSDGNNGGGAAWANPDFAAADDTERATATPTASSFTQRLNAQGFGNTQAPGSSVSGIVVEVQRRCSNCSAGVLDREIYLLKAGGLATVNRATTTPWPTADGWLRVGDVTDTWGTSWTQSDVEDLGFGVVLSAQAASGTPTAEVNAVRLTVFYDVATGQVSASGAGISVPSSLPWQALAGALTGGDTQFASVPGLTYRDVTDALVATGFGFVVPTNATVTGVDFEVARKAGTTSAAVWDHAARLAQFGMPVGAKRTSSINSAWGASLQAGQYGGTADRFGLPLTPADVNDPAFGASLAAEYRVGTGVDAAEVDGFQVRVHYTCP